MRYVYCSDKSAGSLECSARTRPLNSEVCTMPACMNSWKVGDWSEVIQDNLIRDLYIIAMRKMFNFSAASPSCVKS